MRIQNASPLQSSVYYVAGALLLTTPLHVHATTVHYDMDFNAAVDTGSEIVEGTDQLAISYSDTRNPELQAIGSFPDPALVLNYDTTQVNEYGTARKDAVQADLGLGYGFYHIEFDLEVHGLINDGEYSTNVFNVFLAGTGSHLTFRPWTGVTLSNNSSEVFGAFSDDTQTHVSIDLDLMAKTLSADVSGVGSHTINLGYPFPEDLLYVTFSHGDYLFSGGVDDGSWSAIDNLLISSEGDPVTIVPVPGSWVLLCSGLFALVRLRRKN